MEWFEIPTKRKALTMVARSEDRTQGKSFTMAASRPQEREDNLVKFFAFQARAKEPTRKVENERNGAEEEGVRSLGEEGVCVCVCGT